MNASMDAGASLFVFAHQDDELCAAPIIAGRKAAGRPVRVVYLSDGRAGRVSPQLRNAECRNALRSLGVGPDEIDFLGTPHRFPDGALHEALPEVLDALRSTPRLDSVSEVFTLAFEGGHQDHDVAHAVTVVWANELGLLGSTRSDRVLPRLRARLAGRGLGAAAGER